MLKLKDYYMERLQDQAEHEGCLTEECLYCPLNIFDNSDMSCFEIARELLKMLNSQEKK